MPERTAEDIQREIEQARSSLAEAVDQLAERTSPKRLKQQAKQSLIAKAQTPAGHGVIAAVGALVVLMVVRRLRDRSDD
ncbi:MAG: DUF3618 domain-containing protein [Actinomycetota bacterium]